jgi:hypothetical protein
MDAAMEVAAFFLKEVSHKKFGYDLRCLCRRDSGSDNNLSSDGRTICTLIE